MRKKFSNRPCAISSRDFWRNNNGATAIEYGLIIGLVALVGVAGLGKVGEHTKSIFNELVFALDETPAPDDSPGNVSSNGGEPNDQQDAPDQDSMTPQTSSNTVDE